MYVLEAKTWDNPIQSILGIQHSNYLLCYQNICQRKELSGKKYDSSWDSIHRDEKTQKGDGNNCYAWKVVFDDEGQQQTL